MYAVYKFPLGLTDSQLVSMPSTARILTAQFQKGTICLWAVVDLDITSKTDRRIVIAGTGHTVDTTNCEYISTVQDGNFVFHVFEKTGI